MKARATKLKPNGLAVDRRKFLQGAAALAAPCIVPAWVLGGESRPAPSQRITVGLIGHGAMGHGHLTRLATDPAVQVLAVCDVDRLRREAAQRRVKKSLLHSLPPARATAARPTTTTANCSLGPTSTPS